MEVSKPAVRGHYFEDFAVGAEFVTPARTITSTDIVNFTCLSGDFNEVHTNFEYCKTTQFGEPIAHGPMIYGIAGGLQYASGINDGTQVLATKYGYCFGLIESALARDSENCHHSLFS